jgi:preprotein translocase subunit SecG
MFSILLTCLIIVAVIMVAVILLQKSEGSGMSGSQAASMFGGAMTGAGAGNFFTKLTAWLATIFFVICAAMAFIVAKEGKNVNRESAVRQELIKSEAVQAVPAQGTNKAETQKENGVIPTNEPELPDVPEVPEN